MSKIISCLAIGWTCFVVIILSLPQVIPVTATNMNYASPIAGLVLLVTGIWYITYAHRFYKGPRKWVFLRSWCVQVADVANRSEIGRAHV